jgi:tetratricopeptide (TPR) repeat protein
MTEDNLFYTKTMAKVLVDQGNWAKAAEVYRYLLERSPGQKELQEALDDLERRLAPGRSRAIKDLVPLFSRWVDLSLEYSRLLKLKKLKGSLRR